ncbi:hypothetical protein [Halalkalibacter akibai]|uniref:t-SNARE coiled-coil homology domain-containing protein n=1 Tax=Halalkalibacter akibai (strain ATCC 43226 / DSM 21942 / CIP 109018 / JCM 9157 / 1139) TaxID=1236973 RepID=W4QNX9_HALA3|nr:hypothetical protein [Halalkalibacter akibai]GAE33034.1 hypothetical protein JCM9157_17 [Halalkalibacter akibai JCM 9157]
MENEILLLLKQMNEKMDKRFERIEQRLDRIEVRLDQVESRLDGVESRLDRVESRLDRIESRLDQHERLLNSLITMTAKNTEDIHTLRTENNQRFDKLELTFFKMNSDINLLFQETQTNKREIAQLKKQ